MSQPDPAQPGQVQLDQSSGFYAGLALLCVYALFVPGIAALVFWFLEGGRDDFGSILSIAYFLGLPMTAVVALVHWLLRRWSGWTSAGIVIGAGTLLAAIFGPMGIAAALIGYSLVFPLGHSLYHRLNPALMAEAS